MTNHLLDIMRLLPKPLLVFLASSSIRSASSSLSSSFLNYLPIIDSVTAYSSSAVLAVFSF